MSAARSRGALEPRNDRPLVLALALALLVALGVGTQVVAWRLHFSPALGAPLLVPTAHALRMLRAGGVVALGAAITCATLAPLRRAAPWLALAGVVITAAGVGPLYAPWALVGWQARGRVPAMEARVLRLGWAVAAATGASGAIIIVRAWRRRSDAPPSDSHGSARWGTGEGLHDPVGLLLGRRAGRGLRYLGEGHVLTVAPTRSGKGVSCVIPNLLDHPGSVLVTDPKGENYAVTARWRREGLGQPVHAFDPFGVVGGDAALNPLDLIDPASPEAVDDARLIADMLVLPGDGRGGGEGEQSFWNEEARGVLTGLVLHVASSAPPELRTLTHVRTLLTLPPEQTTLLLKEMRSSEAAGGLVARAAARLQQKAEKERSGVVSTAQSHTHFLDSPRMARVLARSTVDLGALKRERASVYLVLPADRMDGYARWLRLVIACALLAVQRERGQPRERVLFLLDEFAHLGRMQPVLRNVGLAGGFGLSFWLVVQDLSQLKSAYGESWPTFLANAAVLQTFGTNDWDTADYLSKLTGEATIRVASENESRGVSRGRHAQSQRGAALTTAEKGRRLLLPDEVRRLGGDAQLLLVKGSAPLLVERVDYRSDAALAPRADPNPLYAPVGV